MLDVQKAKHKIVTYAKSIFDRGLTSGASANMSVRTATGWVVTPTNTCFGFLDPDQLSVIDIHGELIAGDKPSKEFLLHQAFYVQRPDAMCVIHLHSTYATALSCLSPDSRTSCVPTYTPYLTMRLGKIGWVPYHIPGDQALADAIDDAAKLYPGILMANHGPIVAGSSVEKAVFGMEELEESCRIAFLLKDEPRAVNLSDAQIRDLSQRFRPG